jgi:hypothetical protein
MAASTSSRMPSSVSPSSAAAGAVEQGRRDRVVAGVGDAPRDVLDVVVDAEGLLDHDDRGPGLAVGRGLVGAHRSVGGRQLDIAGLGHARGS